MRLEMGKANVESMVNSMGRMNEHVHRATRGNPDWDANNSLISPNLVIFQRKHALGIAAKLSQNSEEREQMTTELHEHGIRHAMGMT